MEINILEEQRVKKKQETTDAKGKKVVTEVEVPEQVPVPFETHEHELLDSAAARYAKSKGKAEKNRYVLRDGVRGTIYSPGTTVGAAVKAGTLLFDLSWR